MKLEPTQKKRMRYAAIIGVVLALVCESLPHEYQAACQIVASICTGGLQ